MPKKNSQEYQEVVRLLPRLAEHERKSVFSILRKLDSSVSQEEAKETRRNISRWTPTLYSILADKAQGSNQGLPQDVNFLHANMLSQINSLTTTLEAFLAELAVRERIKLNQRDRVRWYQLYARLVSKYLTECRVPVTLKTLCQHGDKFSGLLDREFPMYMQNGMLISLVLRGGSPGAPPEEHRIPQR